jgi:ubiquinone/menaquinone biosynthesis C-methylase UbiE
MKYEYEYDRYYHYQYDTIVEGRRAVAGEKGINSEEYFRLIIEKVAVACSILNLENNDSVLEIGSGIGDVSKLLSKTVRRLFCCDVNKSLLLMTQVNCQDCNNISFHWNLNYQEKPLKFLDNNSIDKALACSVFIHCDTDTIIRYVNELHRVLKPEGLFFIRFNKLGKYREPDLAKCFTHVDHNKILETIKELNIEIIKEDIWSYEHQNNKIPVLSLILKKK